jgi:PAS domain S-box-containing protein
MHELARVTLQNEMDLILAHKRSMKLAELAGLSLSAQTTFATAVSEVSRSTIGNGKSGCLILSVESEQRDRYIVACVKDEELDKGKSREGLEYAKRLVNKYHVSTKGAETSIELFYYIAPPFRIDIQKLDEWRSLFRNEPPISPYEELKRKNEQLQDLSEKVQKSEAQYKTVTNSLPLIIFSLDSDGHILYANEWLTRYTGQTAESLNANKWQTVVHKEDYDAFALLFQQHRIKGATTIKIQLRLKAKATGDYLWHQVSLSPFHAESKEKLYWTGFIVDIHAQKVFEETLKDNIELKQTQEQLRDNQQALESYIEELNRSNQELQQFAFVASHDLQEPVRKILFYSDYLLGKYTGVIDDKGTGLLTNMQAASQRMRTLIQDLLIFSQIDKNKVAFKPVDLNSVVAEALQDLEIAIEEKGATLHIDALPTVVGDARMLRQLFENIIGNALKYGKPATPPVIQVGALEKDGVLELSFKDNGIGFDEKYLPQIFNLFQRLHSRHEFEGTGLGLAICRKIADLHGGRIWAEAREGEGAIFYVSLPVN